MIAFIAQRLLTGLVTLAGVALIVFLMMRVLPGDAAVMMTGAGAGVVSEADLAEVRAKLKLVKR